MFYGVSFIRTKAAFSLKILSQLCTCCTFAPLTNCESQSTFLQAAPFASLAAQGFSRGPSACWRRAWKIWCTLCHSTMHPGIMSISTPMAYAPKYLPLWSIPKGADILGKWFTPQTTSKLFRETHLMIMFVSLRSRE